MTQRDEILKELFGTIYGSFDYTFEGKGAWVGHAILAFDGQPPVKATIVDRNTSLNRKPDGGICGTEVITVTIPEKGCFDVLANFTGTPASTPGLYTLDETGHIANGTGAYGQLAGYVVIKGPFLLPDPATTPGRTALDRRDPRRCPRTFLTTDKTAAASSGEN